MRIRNPIRLSDNLFRLALGFLLIVATPLAAQQEKETITEEELKLVEAVEAARIKVVNKVIGSVVAIYGDDKQGGGSGVIIDPSGLALTNHHVIMGAGVEGWGGIADGKLYRWKLVGTDPGGDVSIIQLTGKDKFPHSELGDSDKVRVGDWAFAMGNPFVLTEDQVPTVTLGIVSGVKRFQGGTGRRRAINWCTVIAFRSTVPSTRATRAVRCSTWTVK